MSCIKADPVLFAVTVAVLVWLLATGKFNRKG